MPDEAHSSSHLPILRGLSCRCPRCGKGRLFQGFLTLAPRKNGLRRFNSQGKMRVPALVEFSMPGRLLTTSCVAAAALAVAHAQQQPPAFGTTTRTDGKVEVTYGGHPLYYFMQDKAAGDVKGQGINGFGALWWVVSPSGAAIEVKP